MSRAKNQVMDRQPLQDWEYTALLAHLDPPWTYISTIMWELGLRVSEVLLLARSRQRRGEIQVPRLKRLRGNRWTPVWEWIPLSPALEVMLGEIPGKERYFQVTAAGVWQALKNAARHAGIRTSIHPHLFRHAFGNRMARTDIGASTPLMQRAILQKLMGHKSPRSTDVYFGATDDEVRKAWEKLGKKK